jgi:hypothetical protein
LNRYLRYHTLWRVFSFATRLLTLILNFDLVLKHFNLDYIFWTKCFRALILEILIQYEDTFFGTKTFGLGYGCFPLTNHLQCGGVHWPTAHKTFGPENLWRTSGNILVVSLDLCSSRVSAFYANSFLNIHLSTLWFLSELRTFVFTFELWLLMNFWASLLYVWLLCWTLLCCCSCCRGELLFGSSLPPLKIDWTLTCDEFVVQCFVFGTRS